MPDTGRRTCYLIGPTAFPNYGDELVALGWLRHLARIAPDADVWLDTHSPGPASTLLGDAHPRVRFTDTLWRLCWDAGSDEPWEVVEHVGRAIRDPATTPRWAAGIELLHRADVAHLLGGGYLNSIWPRHLGLLGAMVAVARRSGARTAVTGQGLLPEHPHTGELLRSLLSSVDVVDVRDEPSRQLVGAPATGVDDVFLDPRDHLRLDADPTRPFMVCVQSDLVDGGLPRLAGLVSRTLREWGATPEQVGVVEGIPGQDRRIVDLLHHELGEARVFSFWDLWRSGFPARPGQIWLSTRFHTHLMASVAGAAGVAVDIKPDYYGTKHRSLVDLGSGWVLTGLDDDPQAPPDGAFGTAAVDELRGRKQVVAQQVYEPEKVVAADPPRERWTARWPVRR